VHLISFVAVVSRSARVWSIPPLWILELQIGEPGHRYRRSRADGRRNPSSPPQPSDPDLNSQAPAPRSRTTSTTPGELITSLLLPFLWSTARKSCPARFHDESRRPGPDDYSSGSRWCCLVPALSTCLLY
jgi:hypothetical protein